MYESGESERTDFMRQGLKEMGVAAADLGSSAVDSNRFYSMLLDARSASVTESMYDISERLLKGEKDNAKLALDQLWTLKRTLTDDQTDDTLERLITYYQEKIDVLREKEESIKKVSRETRALIEDKKRKEEELKQVKSGIGVCTKQLRDFKTKYDALRKREDELGIAGEQLKREISAKEAHIVSGLSEIILRHPEAQAAQKLLKKDTTRVVRELAEFGIDAASIKKKAPTEAIRKEEIDEIIAKESEAAKKTITLNPAELLSGGGGGSFEVISDSAGVQKPEPPVYEQPASEPPAPEPAAVAYPKSVVKMGGKVVGEYYHDGNKAAKEQRHYIYNSRFMAERLRMGLRQVKVKFNQELHAELIKVCEDVANRVRDNSRFHYEVSTNEILNDKNLRQLAIDLRRRTWDDAERFAAKLMAKIIAMGPNYGAMLQEQMERCSERY